MASRAAAEPKRAVGRLRAPYPVQGLAENGSAYAAHDTHGFAVALDLVACLTPVRSPASNGVNEAFVKTLKLHYARIHRRPDAATVLQQLPAWTEHYNELHPREGVRMRSLRECIRDSPNQLSIRLHGATPGPPSDVARAVDY
ncbi:integrase core domain-containing protein [Geminicoccus sp.]|uniref:integrase core domain-containing protein n=1 Tax=Geminicoccus sp. TaxID=2024832 RepID=UPI0039C85C89